MRGFNRIRIQCKHLYQSPEAAVTNSHKLCGLKQQKHIPSQFWRPEVLVSVGGSKGNSFFASYSSGVCWHPFFVATSLQSLLPSSHHVLVFFVCVSSCLSGTAVIGFKAYQEIQDDLSHLKILNYIFRDSFFQIRPCRFYGFALGPLF